MDLQEAKEWLLGRRSMTNIIPQHPIETWAVRIAEADSNMIQCAYWIARAHNERLVVANTTDRSE
jgi:hypothetical protein